MEELKLKADKLGIKYSGNIGYKTLEDKIKEVEKSSENINQVEEEIKEIVEEKKPILIQKKSSSTLTVFCKIPMGLEFLIGNRKVKINGLPITGTNQATRSNMFKSDYIVGYGKTNNFSKEDWEYITKYYNDQAWFINKLVFAEEDVNFGEDKAKDLETQLTGFEPIDVEKNTTLRTTKKD